VATIVTPQHVLVAADADEFTKLQAYLDDIGYKIDVDLATRVDSLDTLTITLTYPTWDFKPG
jgi:hypothetical protein